MHKRSITTPTSGYFSVLKHKVFHLDSLSCWLLCAFNFLQKLKMLNPLPRLSGQSADKEGRTPGTLCFNAPFQSVSTTSCRSAAEQPLLTDPLVTALHRLETRYAYTSQTATEHRIIMRMQITHLRVFWRTEPPANTSHSLDEKQKLRCPKLKQNSHNFYASHLFYSILAVKYCLNVNWRHVLRLGVRALKTLSEQRLQGCQPRRQRLKQMIVSASSAIESRSPFTVISESQSCEFSQPWGTAAPCQLDQIYLKMCHFRDLN